jgi:predicted GIY-YIG superfamily endonuclease
MSDTTSAPIHPLDVEDDRYQNTHSLKRNVTEYLIQSLSLVYVLELEHDCWYVGQTSNLNCRIAEHLGFTSRYPGTNWTIEHKPIRIHEVIIGNNQTENEVTETYIELYGADKVQGGKYVTRKKRKRRGNPTGKTLCLICGSIVHTPSTREWCMNRFLDAFGIELGPCA